MSAPEQLFACVSNLWLRQMHFKNAGDANDGHSHLHDHCTLLAKGRLRVTVEGKDTDFSAPAIIYIQKHKLHHLTALEDDCVAYCVHALRTGEREEDIIDPAMVPDGITVDEVFNLARPLIDLPHAG